MIELKNISKSYTSLNGKDIILSDVSIILPNNGFVALCDKSGCGKTTLLNMILEKIMIMMVIFYTMMLILKRLIK